MVPDYTSLREIQKDLHSGKITCRTLVDTYLKNIANTRGLNAYIEVYGNEAKSRADELDQIFHDKRRKMGLLWGAVFSLKDVISFKDHQVTAGSKILHGYKALFSATAVERILAEDAIIIGRVNCDEFAMGSTNENSYYGPVRNAIDASRIPGGSSGGSAVSVQSGTCLMSLGSDTGGSVRQPASFCNVMGFKPSYGRISRHGLIAYASSFDQIGIIGRCLDDLQLAYDVMKGADAYDGAMIHEEVNGNKERSGPYRFAYFKEALELPGLQGEVGEAFDNRLRDIAHSGDEIDAVSFPLLDYVIPCYYVLTSAEASSNLSRYDGIRYGFRAQDTKTLNEMYTATRTEGFGKEVKRRILLGTFVLSVGYYDAYFTKAQKIRRIICDRMADILSKYDAILLPMTPTTAWAIGSPKSPVEIYLADVFSVMANLIGAPAISVPLGFDADNLPFGLQIISAPKTEDKLFNITKHMRKPSL